jgi:hypothetical protein
VADRDRPREGQRGRGPLHRRDTRAHPRRARAPQPRPPRHGLGGAPRRCRLRGRLAAVSAALRGPARELTRYRGGDGGGEHAAARSRDRRFVD